MLEWISSLTDKQIAFAAAVAAIASFLAAVTAVIFSWQATKAAKKANDHSSKANELAGKANDLSIRANEVSVKANDHSVESNRIAVESSNTAKEALTKADQANRISLLSHQKELFAGFHELSRHLEQNGQAMNHAQIGKFYNLTLTAPLFLREPLATQVNDFFNACFWTAEFQHHVVLDEMEAEAFYRANPHTAPLPQDLQKRLESGRAKRDANHSQAHQLNALIRQGLLDALKLV